MPYTEGCLSVPDQYAEVDAPGPHPRPLARRADGKVHEEELDGLLAVCLQHEMDHLEGILFIDHLSRLKRDMVLKKLAKQRKERKSAKPPTHAGVDGRQRALRQSSAHSRQICAHSLQCS